MHTQTHTKQFQTRNNKIYRTTHTNTHTNTQSHIKHIKTKHTNYKQQSTMKFKIEQQ